ncbi:MULTISPECIES: VOC family protein [Methylorubrum]|uniref:VOC family protein n=1 Tax=Methylorubrum TaxID=2282523 RepID=UPI001AE2A439|nr:MULTISPECIES: VOC family protein [Methylorubrum]MCP1535573.1 catechol 2,3-dioxygenase-like lactoylglutathione lyase family enzyme [Methylorubrum extorquens]MCY1640579.1 VOC family protein [Methylorubrum sp. SL192]
MTQDTRTPQPRGIEHVGLTVPDMEAAVRFFRDVFGAEELYALTRKEAAPIGGPEVSAVNGISPTSVIRDLRMLRLHNGPNLELFEMSEVHRPTPTGINDIGLHHFSIYCDDVAAIAAKARDCGAQLLEGPSPLSSYEAGDGNAIRFIRTPWGMLIELIQIPSPGREIARRWLPSS